MLFLVNKFSGGKYYLELKNHLRSPSLQGETNESVLYRPFAKVTFQISVIHFCFMLLLNKGTWALKAACFYNI